MADSGEEEKEAAAACKIRAENLPRPKKRRKAKKPKRREEDFHLYGVVIHINFSIFICSGGFAVAEQLRSFIVDIIDDLRPNSEPSATCRIFPSAVGFNL